jgi:hypothetical protein
VVQVINLVEIMVPNLNVVYIQVELIVQMGGRDKNVKLLVVAAVLTTATSRANQTTLLIVETSYWYNAYQILVIGMGSALVILLVYWLPDTQDRVPVVPFSNVIL